MNSCGHCAFREAWPALAWYTVTLLSAVPAMVISLWIAQLWYGIALHVTRRSSRRPC